MAANERFINTSFVARGEHEVCVVDEDGEIVIGRCYGTTARRDVQTDDLTEIHGEREEVVESAPLSETVDLTFSQLELHPAAQSLLVADGRAPTINNYETLICEKKRGQLLVNENSEFQMTAFGLPQTHNTDDFPAPTAVTPAEVNGGGSLAADDYFAWSVPCYLDMDDKHGIAATDFETLANWANYERGVDYVFGTPSASGTATLAGGTDRMSIGWTPASTGLRPTHHVIVVGTVDDINDADSHVVAIVPWGTSSVTISAVGTVDFGLDPAVGDFNKLQLITGADPLVYTTQATARYTFDSETGVFTLTAVGLGAINGSPIRCIVWRKLSFNYEQEVGGSPLSESLRHIRVRHLRAKGSDPDTQTPQGFTLDFPKVNIAAMAADIITAGQRGWHQPRNVSMRTQFRTGQSYLARFRGENADFENLIDFFSNDVTPANV